MFAQRAQGAIAEGIDTMTPQGGARPGAGRPKGSGTGRKRLAVAISLQPEEKEELERICAELGMTQSDFVRLALKHGAVLAALHREG